MPSILREVVSRSDNIYYVKLNSLNKVILDLGPVARYLSPMNTFLTAVLVSLVSISSFAGQATKSVPLPKGVPTQIVPQGVRIYFANLKNNQTVSKKFTVKFGLEGMKVHPAGEIVEGTGHHHLIIDGSAIAAGQVVPADAQHIHFGKGQTETEVELTPGKHKLTLQFANGAHLSYGPAFSDTIDVVVK